MSTPYTAPVIRPELEDPMDYLPRKVLVEHKKGETIYTEASPATHIFLVLKGAVCTIRRCDSEDKEIVQVYGPDEFFSESSLLNLNGHLERAIALQPTHTMAWTTEEIEALIMRQPKLGIALMQALLRHSLELQESLHSFAFEKTMERTARLMLRLCSRFGEKLEDGTVRLPAFTQELLGKCVGTSREIITLNMNELRRQGYVRYSRKNIFVYEDALKENYHLAK